jgi:hypothetical protein
MIVGSMVPTKAARPSCLFFKEFWSSELRIEVSTGEMLAFTNILT